MNEANTRSARMAVIPATMPAYCYVAHGVGCSKGCGGMYRHFNNLSYLSLILSGPQ